jgi:hypothetical protein
LKNERLILYRAKQKAAPVSGLTSKKERIVEILYSTDALNRFKIEETTIGKVSMRFLVKKVAFGVYSLKLGFLWIKSNVFFRSDFILLLNQVLAYYAHVVFVLSTINIQ